MPWTDEDTKDVLKKVLGGLIAAAILAIIYAILEDMPWYVALLLGIGLVILILIAIWRLGAPRQATMDVSTTSTQAKPSESPAEGQRASTSYDGAPHTSVEGSGEKRSPLPSSERAGAVDDKVAKKAAKAEQKRLKKEAKAREKSSEP